jgi:hypothetical protein
MDTAFPLKTKEELRATTRSSDSLARSVMMSSEMPSEKYSRSASPLMLVKASTAIDALPGGGAARALQV